MNFKVPMIFTIMFFLSIFAMRTKKDINNSNAIEAKKAKYQ